VLDSTSQRHPTCWLIVHDQEGGELFGKHQRFGLTSMERTDNLLYKALILRDDDTQPGSLGELRGSRSVVRDLPMDLWRDQNLAK